MFFLYLKLFLFYMILKKFYILLFILYSFTPCTVKDAFFGVFSLEYAKPTNATKTTTFSSCKVTNQTQKYEQQQVVKQQHPLDDIKMVQPVQVAFFVSDLFSKDVLGRSPPLYILFQQLKIAALFQV